MTNFPFDWNAFSVVFCLPHRKFRLFSAASSDSIRFHSNLLSHDNDLRVSIDNTCTDSLVTALDDEALLINDYMNDMSKSKVRICFLLLAFHLVLNFLFSWLDMESYVKAHFYSPNLLFIKVHFDDVSLYGTPKEEPLPSMPAMAEKTSSNFLKNQLQAWFQPTDNRLAMKLFGSKKALVKERIRQKTAGHWVIHPCSSFRWVPHFSIYFLKFNFKKTKYLHFKQ